jgi:hypothetical protein
VEIPEERKAALRAPTVVLVAEPTPICEDAEQRGHVAQLNQNNGYDLKNLRPGDYIAFAFEELRLCLAARSGGVGRHRQQGHEGHARGQRIEEPGSENPALAGAVRGPPPIAARDDGTRHDLGWASWAAARFTLQPLDALSGCETFWAYRRGFGNSPLLPALTRHPVRTPH